MTHKPADHIGDAAEKVDADSVPVAIELADVARTVAEGDGFWASCSGCYETEDGHPVGRYPHSTVFNCALGSGCSECGGLGAVWDDTDYAAMTAMNEAPQKVSIAVYQVQTGDCWLDMTREQYENHSKTRPTRVLCSQPPQKVSDSVRDADHITDDEVRIALDEMGKIADDPMWSNHCEINKISMRRWIKALRGAYYKGYAEAGYDAEERPVEAQSVPVAWMRTYRQFSEHPIDPDPGYLVTSFHQNADHAAKFPAENVPLYAAPQSAQKVSDSVRDARLARFLDVAAGEGYVFDGIDAGELFLELFPDYFKDAEMKSAPPQKPVSDEVKP